MADIQTHHIYKVYRDGVFLGLLPKPDNEFEESPQINTPGYAVVLNVPVSPDDNVGETGNILSEASDILTAEDGEELLYTEVTNKFGPGTLIDLKNEVVVWEFSQYNPNGVIVFDGEITNIKGNYGGSEDIKVTLLSYGVQLDNYIIESGDGLLIDQSATAGSYGFGSIHDYEYQSMAQTFTLDTAQLISKVAVYLNCASDPLPLTMNLRSGSVHGQGDLLASVTQTISNTSPGWVEFTLLTPVYAVAGTYNWELDSLYPSYGATQFTLGATSDVYAGGSLALGFDVSHSYVYVPTTDEATFRIYTTTGNTTSIYTSNDPSDIMRSIVDDQNARGGRMTYDGSSIDDTGEVVSYTFKVNTVLEGAKKVRELGPSDWYWYGDAATNLVHYHAKGTTADHTLLLGRHISELNLEYTMENIKSVVYFSGGDTGGGTNLFKKYTNTDTVNSYGVRLERISDNRVTLEETSDLLAADVLNNNDTPAYRTTVEIPSSVYNIRLFEIGQMVGFGNFNNRNIDTLLLQIVQIKRTPDSAILSLDTVPPRTSRRVEDMRRNLDKLQTVDNPDAPE